MPDSIELGRLPWIRPLVSASLEHYEAVAPLFAGNPRSSTDWRTAITRVGEAARHRAAMTEVLLTQLERRGAPAAARQAAEQLMRPDAVVIVTGQQVGLFGGPLYTLLKAVTAVRLARQLTQDHGVPVIPLFWAEAEDHDWIEVNEVRVLGRENEVTSLALPPLVGAGTFSCGGLRLTADVETLLATLEATLPETGFTAQMMETLRQHYVSGQTVGAAFAGWMDQLVGTLGMPVFAADDMSAKGLVADVFTAELLAPGRTARLVAGGGEAMRALGHTPQLEPNELIANVFYLGTSGRTPIRRDGDGYLVGDERRGIDDLASEAREHPEHFSPNVMTRPMVQDRLFPTVCYVAGPSELAYHAQLGPLYREFGVERPLLLPRLTVTLLDSVSRRFVERYPIAFEDLRSQDDTLLNRLVAEQLPPSMDATIRAMQAALLEGSHRLRQNVSVIDQTLCGVVDTTQTKIESAVSSLQAKVVQASKRKDETLRRQFQHTRTLAFPSGQPQERALNIAFFVNRYGMSLAAILLDQFPQDVGRHHLLGL